MPKNTVTVLLYHWHKLLYLTSVSMLYPEDGGNKFLWNTGPIQQTTWYHIPGDSNHKSELWVNMVR
jgi:hypothetical protein